MHTPFFVGAKKRAFAHSVLCASLLALLAACGSETPQSADQSAPRPQASDLSPEDLAVDQSVVVGNGSDLESLDPHKVSGVPEANIIRQMLVGLTTTDNDGNTVGGMAESWQSDDNQTWIFQLRDAKWSNGDPVTAHDFVYSFRRLVDPATASPYASYLADAKVQNAQAILDAKADLASLGVVALDDKTLKIELSEPVPYFADMLIHTSVKPVNPKAVQAHGDAWTQAGNYVANGPYILQSWTINEKIVLKRNPSYYDDKNTTIDRATFLPINEGSTEVARYKAGELDLTDGLPSDQFSRLQNELGNQVVVSPSLCTYYYDLNHKKPPFDDPRVRRALALTLDRDTITDGILKQGQKPAYQFTPVATQGVAGHEFIPAWKEQSQQARAEEAKRLLAEAGYSAANPLKFELLYNTNEDHKKLALAAVSFWQAALGADTIAVSLNNKEWKTYLETKRLGDFQMARAGWCADYNEASTFLNVFRSTNSQNSGRYHNPDFDALMLQSLQAGADKDARAEIYKKAEAQLDQDTAAIFVYQYVRARLIKPYVVGVSEVDPQATYQIKDWKISKR